MMEKVKLRSGNLRVPVDLEYSGSRIFLHFNYSKGLIDEIKTAFEGRKWHGYDEPPRKIWSVPITPRNLFQLEYLKGNNPYVRWEIDLTESEEKVCEYCSKWERPLYNHQIESVAHGLITHYFIWAEEMGLGKTLAAIVLMEMSGLHDWMWVGPKSALRAVILDMRKWRAQIVPKFYTYEGLKKVVKEWKAGEPAPDGIIFDEASKLKTPTAQRTVAAKHIADSIRKDHETGFVGLMSGTPAPKSPADWWSLCEIAAPGFLRERDIFTFRNRLGVIEQREQIAGGGMYPHLVAWRDSEDRCGICGQEKNHVNHAYNFDKPEVVHTFVPGINEVAKLHRRMQGLVLVKFKKDCLDLPEKIYEIVRVEPSPDTLRAASLIVKTSRRAIEALTRLRELSDGFQYQEIQEGEEICPLCKGTRRCTEWYDTEFPNLPADPDLIQQGIRFEYNDDYEKIGEHPCTYSSRDVECTNCGGAGVVPKYLRSVIEVPCPKDEVVKEQLDLHDDVGRLNIYAGFTGSVDRVCSIVRNFGWGFIRADGRGWLGITNKGEALPNDKLLDIYAEGVNDYDRLAFIGQPGAAGMGLTLTASPTTLFFSNDFNGESRIQAEDRGHRIGMDKERGGRIVDIIHLPTDEFVLANLQKKKDLQTMSMTGVQHVFD